MFTGDSPAAAQVVAEQLGIDVAVETADIALAGDHVEQVAALVELGSTSSGRTTDCPSGSTTPPCNDRGHLATKPQALGRCHTARPVRQPERNTGQN